MSDQAESKMEDISKSVDMLELAWREFVERNNLAIDTEFLGQLVSLALPFHVKGRKASETVAGLDELMRAYAANRLVAEGAPQFVGAEPEEGKGAA